MPPAARRVRPVAAWEGDVPRTIVLAPGDREASRLRKARLRALGNAVVPQVAEVIGAVVVALEERRRALPTGGVTGEGG